MKVRLSSGQQYRLEVSFPHNIKFDDDSIIEFDASCRVDATLNLKLLDDRLQVFCRNTLGAQELMVEFWPNGELLLHTDPHKSVLLPGATLASYLWPKAVYDFTLPRCRTWWTDGEDFEKKGPGSIRYLVSDAGDRITENN